MNISAGQIRAAMGLLNVKQSDFAETIGVTRQNMSKFLNEKVNSAIGIKKINEMRKALEEMGIEFLEHDGVRFKPTGVLRVLRGSEGFKEFIYDVYDTVQDKGGHVCVSNVDESQFERWQGAHADDYLAKMAKVRDLKFQILVREGDDYHTASAYAEYRQLPAQFFDNVPTYIYNDKKAEILFSEDDVTIFLFENKQLADAQRKHFKILWERAIG